MGVAFLVIAAAAAQVEPTIPGAPIPAAPRAMLQAAAQSDSRDEIAAVARAAKIVFPDSSAAIDAEAAALTLALEERLRARIKDVLVVTGAPPAEKAAPKISANADAVDLESAPAPRWLKLGPWAGKASASGIVASGNARNAAAGVRIEARRELETVTHNINAYFDYGKSNGRQSQQRWGAAYKLDYKLGDRSYAYGRLSYDEDAFSGFDYKLFSGFGIGRFFFDDDAFKLKAEAGPGYQYSPIDDTRVVDRFIAAYASGELDWIITKGVKFEQDINATRTAQTSTIISNTALTTSLTDTLSTGVSYFVRYESNPPLGRVNTDTTFRLNLTYGF